jgi:hypothetical protein
MQCPTIQSEALKADVEGGAPSPPAAGRVGEIDWKDERVSRISPIRPTPAATARRPP